MEAETKKKLGIVGGIVAVLGGVYYFFIKPKPTPQLGAGPKTLPPVVPPQTVIPGTTVVVPTINLDQAYQEAQRRLQSIAAEKWVVSTKDEGPSGYLNVRDVPNGNQIGQFAKGAIVSKTDGPQVGWLKVMGTDVNSGQPVQGWVSGLYLTPLTMADAKAA